MTKLQQRILATVIAALLFPATIRGATNQSTVIWFNRPAAKWTEALPIGNGRMGAMVFGGITGERIQFNEDTLWRGKPHDYVRAGAGDQLAPIRRMLADGKIKEASALAKEKFLSDPVRQLPYQPFGDLRFHFPGHENATNYRRELDLDSALATVSYKVDDVTFKRETFASYPDRIIVVRLTADKPGQISFTLKLTSPHTNSQTFAVLPYRRPRCAFSQPLFVPQFLLKKDQDIKDMTQHLLLAGKVPDDGLSFASGVRARLAGGKLCLGDRELIVTNADSVTLLLAAATSFKNFQAISGEPQVRVTSDLKKAAKRSYDDLRARHIADHQKLFRRVSLDLERLARHRTFVRRQRFAQREEKLRRERGLLEVGVPSELTAPRRVQRAASISFKIATTFFSAFGANPLTSMYSGTFEPSALRSEQ